MAIVDPRRDHLHRAGVGHHVVLSIVGVDRVDYRYYEGKRQQEKLALAGPRPMRGLKRLRSARVISTGHAFVQNLRRGHYYELGVDGDPQNRIADAFFELTRAI